MSGKSISKMWLFSCELDAAQAAVFEATLEQLSIGKYKKRRNLSRDGVEPPT